MKLTADLNLDGHEIRNGRFEEKGTWPSNPKLGQLFFYTAVQPPALYWWDGSSWVSTRPGITAIGNTEPSYIIPGSTSTPGSDNSLSRADHIHGLQNLPAHAPVRVATTANITLNDEQTVDGIALFDGDRVLVKNQNTVSQNGIYIVVESDAWDRADDADSTDPDSDLLPGTILTVSEGASNANTQWILTRISPIVIGTTSLTFALIPSQAGSTATTSAPGDVGSGGVSGSISRSDHKHAREGFGNPTAQTTFGASSTPGAASTLARSDHTHGTPAHGLVQHQEMLAHNDLTDTTITAPVSGHTILHNGTQFVNSDFDTRVRTTRLDQMAAPTADVSFNNRKIINVVDPIAATDVANKQYVDAAAIGIKYKTSVRLATTANITLSGLQTIDGVVLVAANRILVKNQTTASQNGIYSAASGAWTRTTDADGSGELAIGSTVLVQVGTTQGAQQWSIESVSVTPWVPGSTTTVWAQISTAIPFGIPGTSAPGDVASAGTDSNAARADHKHGREAYGTSMAAVSYTATSPGSSAAVARADHVHQADLSTTAASTQAVGDAATVGTATTPARADHKHAMPVFGAVVPLAPGAVATSGVSNEISRADHNHGLPSNIGGSTQTVRAVITTNITLFGGYTIDGVALEEGDRVLVMGQDDATANGIYVVDFDSTWLRASDADSTVPDAEIKYGSLVAVVEGILNATSLWIQITESPVVIGTSELIFVKSEKPLGTPGVSRVGDIINAGTATIGARADHVHGREDFGAVVPQTTNGVAATSGFSNSVSRADHTHGTPALTSNAASVAAVGDAAAVGSGTLAAHSDHKHGMPAFGTTPSPVTPGATASGGIETTIARSDHTHATPGFATPGSQAIGDGAVQGSAPTFARSDHKHAMPGFGPTLQSGGFGAAASDGTAATIARSDHTHGAPIHNAGSHTNMLATTDLLDVTTVAPTSGDTFVHNGTEFVNTNFDTRVRTSRLDQMAAPTADVSVAGRKIVNVADPIAATDAANKAFVDAARSGLSPHAAVRVAVPGNINIAAPGATIDGITMVAGDRVLLKSQTTPSQNGSYTWNSAAGAMTRTTDADASGELIVGATYLVLEGAQNAGSSWMVLTSSATPWIPGSTTTTWTESGKTQALGSVIAETQFGITPSDGLLSTVSRSDHTHGTPALSSTNPADWTAGATVSVGVGTTAARADHRHAAPGFGNVVAETAYGQIAADGVATTLARADHSHGTPSLASTTPVAETIGAGGAVGVGTTAARADHVHPMPAFGTSATDIARGDHTHPVFVQRLNIEVDFGSQGGGLETTVTKAVTAPWVTANTIIMTTNSGLSTVDHDPEDAGVDGVQSYAMNIVPGAGFNLLAFCPTGTWGKYLISVVA